MSKFHIGRNGEPAVCTAQSGNCPLGGASSHFDNSQDAIAESEHRFTVEAGGVFAGAAQVSTGGVDSTWKRDLLENAGGDDKQQERLIRYHEERERKLRERLAHIQAKLDKYDEDEEATAEFKEGLEEDLRLLERELSEAQRASGQAKNGEEVRNGSTHVAVAEIPISF